MTELSQELEEWLAERPQVIRDLARGHPPDGTYRLANSTDEDFYFINSYCENGTITATRYTRLAPEAVVPMWNVFGMQPEDLVRVDEEATGD